MRKKTKNLDKRPNTPSDDIIANAIHLTNAFGFKAESAIKMINGGLLGFKVDEKGELIKGPDQKSIPLTISRASYYNYLKKYSEMPEYYKELREFALGGYSKLAVGFQKELTFLHAMAAEILLSTTDKTEKLHAIDLLVSKVIPTQSAFADILREMLEDNPGMMSEPTKDEPKGEQVRDESTGH